jgi:3-oxoacyl-[acyl-carrier protein] reductase
MGYEVVINYARNEAAAQETLRLIGGRGELMRFDVTDAEAVDEALMGWSERHAADEYLSVVVNNAGIRDDSLMMMMTDEQWHGVIDTDLNGMFYVTRRALKDMLYHRWGRIVNMCSLSGVKGLPGQTNYSAAKAGLIGASKALAQETARRGVTVNCVAPGFVESDMTRDLDVAELKKLVPMQRFAKPEEVAAVVGFLASEGASYITGAVIPVNGGLYT